VEDLPDTADGLRDELSALLLAQHQDSRALSEYRVIISTRAKRITAVSDRLDELES
jgi:hypothetical protein